MANRESLISSVSLTEHGKRPASGSDARKGLIDLPLFESDEHNAERLIQRECVLLTFSAQCVVQNLHERDRRNRTTIQLKAAINLGEGLAGPNTRARGTYNFDLRVRRGPNFNRTESEVVAEMVDRVAGDAARSEISRCIVVAAPEMMNVHEFFCPMSAKPARMLVANQNLVSNLVPDVFL